MFRSVFIILLLLPHPAAAQTNKWLQGIDRTFEKARVSIGKREAKEESLLQARALQDWDHADLRWLFAPLPGEMTRKDLALLRQIRAGIASEDSELVSELSAVFQNRRRFPFPRKINAFQLPLVHFRFIFNPVGNGEPGTPGTPANSSFWQQPPTIGEQNLFAGFGRKTTPAYSEFMLNYEGPKTGFGYHPGFDARENGAKYKVKFGEIRSEPFTARIFHALGYNVDPTDFVLALRLKYDRRFFREFNMRQDLAAQISMLGAAPVFRVNYQPHWDPFDFIQSAVLRNGLVLSPADFKRQLLKDPARVRPEEHPENFHRAFEDEVDYLITRPASIQPEQPGTESLGSWDYGQLGHASRRELRGLGLLAAWVSWFDARSVNTKLRKIETNGRTEYRHFLSDLGGGLGRSRGLLQRSSEDSDGFEWCVSKPQVYRGPGKMTLPFRIDHFEPNEDNPAFAAMTTEDARWMARALRQITEEQLTDALLASGFDSATARLYTAKLVARRDSFAIHLGLENDVELLSRREPNR